MFQINVLLLIFKYFFKAGNIWQTDVGMKLVR